MRVEGLGPCPPPPEGPKVEEGVDMLNGGSRDEPQTSGGHAEAACGSTEGRMFCLLEPQNNEQAPGEVGSAPPMAPFQCSREKVACTARGLPGLVGRVGGCWSVPSPCTLSKRKGQVFPAPALRLSPRFPLRKDTL